MRHIFRIGLAGAFVSMQAIPAGSHTTSIGYENAGPGSVTFWFGTYNHSTSFNEGSLMLVGPGISTTVPFNLLTSTKPSGLIDGTTYFYCGDTSCNTLAADNSALNLAQALWQGATFNGLAAGAHTFTYVPIANPTATWDPWGPAILSNTVTLTQAIVQGMMEGEIHPAVGAILLNGRPLVDQLMTRFDVAFGGFNGPVNGQLNGVNGIDPLNYAGIDAQRTNAPFAALNYAGDSSGILSGSQRAYLWGGEVWLSGHGNLQTIEADGTAGKIAAHSGGLSIGYDKLLSPTLRAGVAASYEASEADVASASSSAEVDTGRIGGFVSHKYENWILSGIAEYAFHGIASERVTMSGTAVADYEAHQLSSYAEAAYRHSQGDYDLEPFAGIYLAHLSASSFTETGAGAANLSSDGETYTELNSLLGLRISKPVYFGKSKSALSTHIAWEHAFGDASADATLLVGGTPSAISSSERSPDRILLGAGLSTALSDQTLLEFGYSGKFSDSEVTHELRGILRIALGTQ